MLIIPLYVYSVKLKTAALQGLLTLARAYDHSNWQDHIPTLIPELLSELKVNFYSSIS